MEAVYDVDYFIKKFEAIPKDEWYVGNFVNESNLNQRCALGHCDFSRGNISKEGTALIHLFVDHFGFNKVPPINDGEDFYYQQPTPKQRILAALYDIKEKDKK